MIVEVTRNLEESADAVVIGTGAGGSVVAALLAEANMKVAVLEAGGYYTGKDFNQREGDMLAMLYEERGARATVDSSIAVLQARCVGGTPVINDCICFRTPPEVLKDWRDNHGLDAFTEAELLGHFEAVERDQKVQKLPQSMVNKNDTILQRGAKVKGIRTDTFMHNREGCLQSGFCKLGCTFDRKVNSLTVYVPRALQAGARLFPFATVERILVENGRVRGIEAAVRDADPRPGEIPPPQNPPRRLLIRAPRVFLCAGTINTPQILLNSRVANSNGRVGQGLALHPLAACMGVFEEEIKGYAGIPQCVYTHDFTPEKGDTEGGFIIEGIFSRPGLLASATPGLGLHEVMALYNHISAFYAQVRDSSRGSVSVNRAGRPLIEYTINQRDWAKIRHAHKVMASIFLAAGAKWVSTTHSEQVYIRTEKDIEKLDRMPYRPNSLSLFSAHPQGSCPMGADPRTSVVDASGQSHEVKGLYLADASIFPSPTGVNPMITVNTLAHRIATLAIK